MQNGMRFMVAAVAALVILAADPMLTRIDSTYVSNAGDISYAQGTATISPVAPTLPSGSLGLANFFVGSKATTMTSSCITALRIMKNNVQSLFTGTAKANVADLITKSPCVDVRAFGAKGDGVSDDTVPIQNAVNAGLYILIPKGYIFVIDTINLPSDIHLYGGGTLKFKNNTTSYALLNTALSNDIKITDIIFDGNITNQASWLEHRHAIKILSTNNAQVLFCKFINLIGDGVYISHNELVSPYTGSNDVTIAHNDFIGNNTNRNGVSLICGTDIKINGNTFNQMAKNNMPGAIDIEPDNNQELISNVKVYGNTIKGGTASNLQQGIAVQNSAGATIDEVSIYNNTIDGAFRFGIATFNGGVIGITNLKIQGNTIKNLSTMATELASGIITNTVPNIDISSNTITNIAGYGIKTVGGTGGILNNTISLATYIGIAETSTSDCYNISGNTIDNCGNIGNIIYGGIQITGSKNRILRNNITCIDASKTQVGIYIASGTQNYVDFNYIMGVAQRTLSFGTGPQILGSNNILDPSASINGTTNTSPHAGTWKAEQRMCNYPPTASGYPGLTCTVSATPEMWKKYGSIQT
jgi:hypothetical protein